MIQFVNSIGQSGYYKIVMSFEVYVCSLLPCYCYLVLNIVPFFIFQTTLWM